MEPNSGFAAGSYFASAIKVPHGHNGMYTSSLKLYVPKGIMSAVPEIPTGWNCTITNRQLPVNERYMSHGSLVTTAPDTILWEAETADDTVSNSHLLMILVQFKLGCVFNESSSAKEPDLVRDVQRARSVANEELLEALEDNTVLNLADLDGLKNDYARAIAIASIALALSALVSVIFLALGCLRIFDKSGFAKLVFTEPITSSKTKHDNL